MPRADWNVLKKYSLPKPSDGLLAVNDTVHPITAVPVGGHQRPRFAERILWKIAGVAGSIRFEARELDHLGPLLGFVDDQLFKVGG